MLASLALALLSADATPAAPKPLTAVFVFGDDTLAERLAGKIEVELAERLTKKNVPMVDLGALFPAPKPPPDDEGDALIKEGKEAYDNLDLDACIAKLTDAALHYIKHPELTDPKKLAELFVYLGAAEQQNSVKTYEKEFARAIKLNPDFAPDPKFFGADVQKAYSKVRADLETKSKASVIFESSPAGASIELNGKAMGHAPLASVDLTIGRHFVRATRPGFIPAAKFPEVTTGGEEIDVKLELAPVASYAPVIEQAKRLANKQTFDTAQLPVGGAQLGQMVQARFLVLATAATVKGSTKVEAQVWDTATGERLRELKFDSDEFGMSNAADTISRWIDRPAPVAIVEAKPTPATSGSGSGLLNKPWFWAVVGVVAVGAAAGAGYGVVASQGHHHYNPITDLP